MKPLGAKVLVAYLAADRVGVRVTQEDVADMVGVATNTVRYHAKELKDNGFLANIGRPGAGSNVVPTQQAERWFST